MNKPVLSPGDVVTQMASAYYSHLDHTGNYPEYAKCLIQYKDNDDTVIEKFKLDNGTTDEDDDVFYFCSSIEDLKGLADPDGSEDFFITEFLGFE